MPLKIIQGNILSNFEELLILGEADASKLIQSPIHISNSKIIQALQNLECDKSTLLGSAFLYSFGLAKKGGKASEIIVCTDGIANIGLGSVGSDNPQEIENSRQFYIKVGNLAKECGVKVSLLSIVDLECKLEMLSPIVDLTGGIIRRVNPLALDLAFNEILKDPLVATEVKYESHIQHFFEFSKNSTGQLFNENSNLMVEIGNISKNSTYTH